MVQQTEYKIKDITPGFLCRLQMFDYSGKPLANTEYELKLDNSQYSGTTDSEGWIEEFDHESIKEGSIKISGLTYKIIFKEEESEDTAFWQSILNALGYSVGPIDGIKGRHTTQAIRSFQREMGLKISGEIDNETKQKLKEEFRLA